MSTDDFAPPSSYSASAFAGSTNHDPKRSIFGRKKNESTESLNSSDMADAASKLQTVKNVFKRKSKNDLSTSIEEPGDSEARGSSKGAEDDMGYTSDTESSSVQKPRSSSLLSSNPGTQLLQKVGNRRSTSPQPPQNISRHSPATLDQEPERRPSTSGGEMTRPIIEAPPVGGVNGAGTFANSVRNVNERKARRGSFPALVTGNLEAPKITATPPTPTDQPTVYSAKSPVGTLVNGTGSGRHSPKRARGNSINTPSKLSQSMTSPQTPPGAREGTQQDLSTMPPQLNGSGFFQSMFSAAQNAATQLTNNIPMNLANQNRSRSATLERLEENSTKDTGNKSADGSPSGREPAVKTLGQGELDLAALGIVPDPESTPDSTRNSTDVGGRDGHRIADRRGQATSVPNSAISGYSGFETAGESPIGGGSLSVQTRSSARTPMAEDNPAFLTLNNSVADGSERGSISGNEDNDGDGERKRSGSVRSGVGSTNRRERGSSAASSGIGLQPLPKPTGFAVASKKRNRDYHNLFRSVPEDDYLIEDYGCALQREILLHGRLYVSEGHICFYSNIIGWVTTLVISFDEVMSVEKKSTALLFPNAIVIQTLHAKHIFASFISRDPTYDLIVGLWNVRHPQLIQGQGEAHLGEPLPEEDGVDTGDDEEEYEETDDELGGSMTDGGDGTYDDPPESAPGKVLSTRTSQLQLDANKNITAAASAGDFPGPVIHGPTSCGCEDQHYDKLLCNEVVPAPLGQVFSFLFGPKSYQFLTQLLNDEEKVLELSIPNQAEWEDVDGKKTRQYTYIKPLGGSIGPKQTRCNITETQEFNDLDDHVTVTVSTQTPDVPSGGVFLVKTRYCISWAEDNCTRLVSTCTVEWSGKSWIKGPIEKGASDGQVAYCKSLVSLIRREAAPKRPVVPTTSGKKTRRKGKNSPPGSAPAATTVIAASPQPAPADWGVLEFTRPVFGPIVDIVKPILPANFSTILLLLIVGWLLVRRVAWTEPVGKEVAKHGMGGGKGAWEDAWRTEEENLWDWIEDRAGVERILAGREGRVAAFEGTLKKRGVGEKMKERQVDEAIRVMEERLQALKRVVDDSETGRSSPTT